MKSAATIYVQTPCTCGAAQWFRCDCSDVVAEYECGTFDGMDRVPHPKCVAQVERMHPGMALRYIKSGSTFDTYLREYRSKP